MDKNLLQKNTKLENLSIEAENLLIESENLLIEAKNPLIEAENSLIEADKTKIYYPYFLNLDDLEGFTNENIYLLEDIKSENYEYAEDISELKLKEEIVEVSDKITKAEVKTETKAEVKTETKAEVKTETKAEVKTETKAEVKTETKAEVKTETKAEVKTETKAEVKTETKAEVKTETKAEVKTETKAEVKTETSIVVNSESDEQELVLLTKLAEEEALLKKLAEEEEKLKKKIKQNKIFCLLYFFICFIRKLENPLIKYTEELSIIITTKKEKKFELLIIEDYLAFELVDLKKYFIKLKNFLIQAEDAQTKYEFLYNLNQLPIINHEHQIYYPAGFNKTRNNLSSKSRNNLKDWIDSNSIRQTTKYFSEYKPRLAKSKINALLKDKLLVRNIFKCVTLTNHHAINRRTLKKIRRYIKKKKVFTLVKIILQRLLFRRILLWKDISISMRKLKFVVIGKDYKVYRKKIARTYVTNTKQFTLNYRKKKRLNSKHIKCIEIFFKKKRNNRFLRVLKKIYKLNYYLNYFYKRFYKKLKKYRSKMVDKHFAIPYRSKILTFDETLFKLAKAKKKEKKKIFKLILLVKKHNFEKKLLKKFYKRRQLPLELFLQRMEKEKYYPKYKRTQFRLKIKKWLDKYIHQELANEYRESFTRPRVILEKLEDAIEVNYPYLPRDPLTFQRDLDAADFKKKKFVKSQIIRFTKPVILLQSNFFSYSKKSYKIVSHNLLHSKLNSKIHIPERVQRIRNLGRKFYINFFKDNSYSSYKKFLDRLKILFIYKPHLKKKRIFIKLYFLALAMKPMFNGIQEEQEYSRQLQEFLNNYLIRLRLNRRYNLAQSIYRLKRQYIIPRPEQLAFIKRLRTNTHKIMKKRPYFGAMKFMHRKSLKRLTIRIRSQIAAVRGIMPFFKHNLMATEFSRPMDLKKKFKNKGYHYLFQPDLNKKVKAKYRFYTSSAKRSYGYSITFQTIARFYYFSQFNLFGKNLTDNLITEDDKVAKYQAILASKNTNKLFV